MSLPDSISSIAVAEMQGSYGAYTFPEKLLQLLWLRGDFDLGAATTSGGDRLHIIHPGKWNLLGGPDFLGARIQFGDGPVVAGDVEVHFRERDWKSHGHDKDPAYAGVILHVVLFPPTVRHATKGMGGRPIPVVALLPLLRRSLEEFAIDQAAESLANRPAGLITEFLGQMPRAEITRVLISGARERWIDKVHFARARLQQLGWCGACHHAALEILGFRFNRAPMLRCATRWPLSDWADGGVSPEIAHAAEAGRWSLQGIRPANHPLLRLRQYAALASRCPDWPDKLRVLAAELELVRSDQQSTQSFRGEHRLAQLKRKISTHIFAGAIGGTRLDTLVCDGILPLLSAETGRDLFETWHCWYLGDIPRFLSLGLRHLTAGGDRSHPRCQGEAQGLLGWLLKFENAARPSGAPPA